MSVEVIAVIITAASLLVTVGGGMFAGFAWVLRRMDERFNTVDQRFNIMDQKFERVDQRFERIDQRFELMDEKFVQIDKKLDQKFESIDERMHGLQGDLTDVKVAVARLEGPQPRLIFPR